MINRSSKISRDYRIKLLKSWSCPDLNFKSYVEVSWILSRLGLVGDASTLNRCNLCGLTNLNLKNFACREISIEFRKRWKSRTFYTNNVRHNYTMHNQLWGGCWVGGGGGGRGGPDGCGGSIPDLSRLTQRAYMMPAEKVHCCSSRP